MNQKIIELSIVVITNALKLLFLNLFIQPIISTGLKRAMDLGNVMCGYDIFSNTKTSFESDKVVFRWDFVEGTPFGDCYNRLDDKEKLLFTKYSPWVSTMSMSNVYYDSGPMTSQIVLQGFCDDLEFVKEFGYDSNVWKAFSALRKTIIKWMKAAPSGHLMFGSYGNDDEGFIFDVRSVSPKEFCRLLHMLGVCPNSEGFNQDSHPLPQHLKKIY